MFDSFEKICGDHSDWSVPNSQSLILVDVCVCKKKKKKKKKQQQVNCVCVVYQIS